MIEVILLAELAGIAFARRMLTNFECRALNSELTCQLLRGLVVKAIVIWRFWA